MLKMLTDKTWWLDFVWASVSVGSVIWSGVYFGDPSLFGRDIPAGALMFLMMAALFDAVVMTVSFLVAVCKLLARTGADRQIRKEN